MGDNSVALGALAVLGTCVGLMVYVVKKVLNDVAPALNRHAKAADGITAALKESKEVSVQQAKYLAQALLTRADADAEMMGMLNKLDKTVELVGKTSGDLHVFMKNLNGKLAKATIQTVAEQNVETQHVHNEIVERKN